MNRFRLAAVFIAAMIVFVCPASAQGYGKVQQLWFPQGKISGGISVSGTSAATQLPTSGQSAWICNSGTTDAYLAFGPTNSATATVNGSSWLKAGTCGTYDLNPFTTLNRYVAAITASSTTTLAVETGLGDGPMQLASSGGGSSGAVFGPTAAGTAAANPPVIIGGTVDGTATGAVDNLKVSGGLAFISCANCSGSGASAADEAAFVAGTSLFAPSGGFYQTTATSNPLTTGQQGLAQMTANRALFMNVRNSSGAELGLTAAPFIVAGAGTAGAASGGVVTVQGVASMTPVFSSIVSGSNTATVKAASTSPATTDPALVVALSPNGANPDLTPVSPNTATATKADLLGMQYNSTQATFTNGQQGSVQGSSRGALFVAVGADGFAVTNAGTFATQSAITAASGSIAAGAVSAGAFVSGSVLSGAYASGSLASGAVVDLTNIEGVIGNATAPTKMAVGGLVYNSTPLTLTNGQSSALQGDANGYLNVHIQAGAGSGGTALADNSAFTQSTTSETPIGCLYNTSYAAATSGHSTIPQCDSSGHLLAGAAQATVTAGNSLNAVTANTTGTSIPIAGYGSALVNVNCSVNCTGGTIVNFQALDVVGTGFAIGAIPVTGGAVNSINGMVTSVTNLAGSAQFCIPNFGYTTVRATVTSYSAGTISATITPFNGSSCSLSQVSNGTNSGQTTASASSPVVLASNQTAADPCMFQLKSFASINLTASGQVITGTASKKTYICSISLLSGTAQNVALVEGTGTTCATNIFGLAGGTTAATGWNLAANGGLTHGNGGGLIYYGSGDANATAANVCLLSSSTGQISGSIGYVQQ
jgi:hypothetical protein